MTTAHYDIVMYMYF